MATRNFSCGLRRTPLLIFVIGSARSGPRLRTRPSEVYSKRIVLFRRTQTAGWITVDYGGMGSGRWALARNKSQDEDPESLRLILFWPEPSAQSPPHPHPSLASVIL